MAESLLQQFQVLNVWQSNGRRAPHKPLLALWAIGRCLRGEPRLAPYELVDRDLRSLLRRFGPHRSRVHPEYPFWHMCSDAVWEVDQPRLVRTTSGGGPWITDLKAYGIQGGFTPTVYRALAQDHRLALEIAESLVAKHFPETIHNAVLEATAVPFEQPSAASAAYPEGTEVARRRRRDPAFRSRILEAYGSRCAVCSFAANLNGTPLSLEAAHIKWHEAEGPPIVENGLALCALHHDLFDTGAFTVLPDDLKVLVAPGVEGHGTDTALRQFHGRPLFALPLPGFPQPSPRFLKWHASEVFKQPEAAL